MIPVTIAVEDADGGACSTSGATISAPGNYTTSVDATFSRARHARQDEAEALAVLEIVQVLKALEREPIGLVHDHERTGALGGAEAFALLHAPPEDQAGVAEPRASHTGSG